MNMLTETDRSIIESTEGILNIIKTMLQNRPIGVTPTFATKSMICSWFKTYKSHSVKISVIYRKKILAVKDLSTRSRGIYDKIIETCPTDSDMLRIQDIISRGPM